MAVRAMILSFCLLAGAVGIAKAARTEAVPPRESFASFPRQLGRWVENSAEPLPADILRVLGVDDYLNRVYSSQAGTFAGLYIGYYATQRQDDTIHSPMNCLPGAGWQPISREYVSLTTGDHQDGGQAIRVNRVVIEKGLERDVVLYWYQSHGRVIPNEYWSKAFLVYDALRLNRTDAALVRVSVPLAATGAGSERVADEAAADFARTIHQLLGRYIPT